MYASLITSMHCELNFTTFFVAFHVDVDYVGVPFQRTYNFEFIHDRGTR